MTWHIAETDDYKLAMDDDNPETIYVVNPPFDGTVEVWHDHAGSGSGYNNLELKAFDRDLDLEFCSSITWSYWPDGPHEVASFACTNCGYVHPSSEGNPPIYTVTRFICAEAGSPCKENTHG